MIYSFSHVRVRYKTFHVSVVGCAQDAKLSMWNLLMTPLTLFEIKWIHIVVYKLCETVFTANISGYVYCTKLLYMFALKYFKHINKL